MSHRAESPEPPRRPRDLIDWPTSLALAAGGAVVAVGLIVVFTFLVDWVGEFWSQAIYFVAVFGVIVALALRDRAKDYENPDRRRRGAQITPAGLPGPFVFTQAVGVLGVVMLVIGAGFAWIFDNDERGLVWFGGGLVLTLLGAVGLAFWLSGLRGQAARR